MKRLLFIIIILFLFNSCDQPEIKNCSSEYLNSKLIELKQKDQNIRRELIDVYNEYQKSGDGFLSLMWVDYKMDNIDEDNQEFLNTMIQQCDWKDELNEEAQTAIFLIIDHSDLEFIERYYDLVKEKYESGVIKASDFATLTDRKLMYQGQLQLYGTQSFSAPGGSKIMIWPIKNTEKLAQRRSKMNLPSMQEYIQTIKDSMSMEVYWDKDLSLEEARDLK